MGWQMAPYVSFCTGSGRTVFLDIARDRYFALPLPQSAAFLHWQAAPEAVPAPPVLRALAAAGLLVETDKPTAIAPPAIAPPRGSLSLAPPAPRLRTICEVAHSMIRVRQALRRRGLAATLDHLCPTGERTGTGDARERALAFLGVRRHWPAKGSCLPDSLAMIDYLRRHGASASIVFGIIGAPFQAHCWVQCGDEVLNDALDHVAPFSAILRR